MSALLLAFAALLTILLFAGGCGSAAGTQGVDDGWGSVLDTRPVATAPALGELPHVEEKGSPPHVGLGGSRFSDPYATSTRAGKAVAKTKVANGACILSRAPPSGRRCG